MKVINLFGSPGTGKSTTAAGLFFLMKTQGYRVELVTEYAKDLTWSKRDTALSDQLYILGKQNHRLQRIKDQVDYAITDSPILFSNIYAPDNYHDSFEKFVREVFDSYDNINFFLKKVKPHVNMGRDLSEAEANIISAEIKSMLLVYGVNHHTFEGDSNAPQNILDKIKELENE